MFAVLTSNLTFPTHGGLSSTITKSGQTQRLIPFPHAVYSIFAVTTFLPQENVSGAADPNHLIIFHVLHLFSPSIPKVNAMFSTTLASPP